MNGKPTEFNLAYGVNKEKRLWIVVPDLSALIKDASPLAEYTPYFYGFGLRNEALYLSSNYYLEDKKDTMDCADIHVSFGTTMPRFELSAENVKLASPTVLNCDCIGIGNCVYIHHPAVNNDGDADYVFTGKAEWFADASAIMAQVAEKYHLLDVHQKYLEYLPALRATEEKLRRAEEELRKPKGLLAKIFGR